MGYKDIQFDSGTKFLVTGGAGFIGSNLCEALLEMGHSVRCLDNFSTGKNENLESFRGDPQFELVEGDIRDLNACLESCEDIDFVLHQAAWGSVPRSIEMPLLYEEINIKGTLNLMEAATHSKVRKFIYASSSSVYGDSQELPKREDCEGKVLSPYALTKKANEEYGRLYYELYGLETYGLRYFNVFGRRQDPDGPYAAVIPKFIKSLMNDEAPTIYGDGTQSRDFTYIDNVIEANLRACQAPTECAGQVFNVACGGQETLMSVYNTLCDLLSKDIAPIYSHERVGDIRHSNADIQKARKMLGYEAEFGFEQGIKLHLGWYLTGSL